MKAKEKLNKLTARVKENFMPDGQKVGLVFIGMMGTLTLNKAIDKLLETHPNMASWAKYVRPLAEIGGGLFMASALTPTKAEKREESLMKYLGYGVALGGGIDGVKLIPVASDLFAGLGEIQMPSVYYTEQQGNQPQADLSIASLPVASLSLQAAPSQEIDLPDLDAVSTDNTEGENTDLGYNPDMTRDVDDLNGLM